MGHVRFVKMVLALTAVLSLLSVGAWGSTFKVIYNFTGGQDGANPVDAGALAIDGNGNLYGTTGLGGACGEGTLFQLSPNAIGGWTETVWHSFCGPDGIGPTGSLEILGPPAYDSVTLFGTTPYGGPFGTGSFFEAVSGGSFYTLYDNFNCSDFSGSGCLPYAGVSPFEAIPAYLGGTNGAGALQDSLYGPGVYEFCSLAACADGANPASQVVASEGNVADGQNTTYGTTHLGGVNNLGVVYALTYSSYSVLHSFAGGTNDGAYPFFATLTLTPQVCAVGSLCSQTIWGTTPLGGAGAAHGGAGYGTVFAIPTFSPYYLVHSFNLLDGAYPYAGLTNLNGTFYGTTSGGGFLRSTCCPPRLHLGRGTIYSLTSNGTLTTLHTFAGPDGALPYSGLVADSSGNLYGVTFEGGAYGAGVVYEITP
jgi:uncharacterized repeat protein (TIGR03803 family)